jgi:hypothetical protein
MPQKPLGSNRLCPASPPSKRTLVTAFVILLTVLAGCGGNSTDSTETLVRSETNDDSTTEAETAVPPIVVTNTEANGTIDTATTTEETTAKSTFDIEPITAIPNSSRSSTDLNVIIEPHTADTANVTLRIYATVNTTSATDGIRNATVNVGKGLNISNVTAANVETVGIDEDGNQPGSLIDGQELDTNVEGGIDIADDGESFKISLDGERSIETGDEIVAVVDGGITTTKPGEYIFSLSINNAPLQRDTYNVTSPAT